ncbi:Golgi transport complex subunit 3 [Nowakowskiella sp. JEL0407]|nr:Golgi transport complex subunit 3 [Nowakowskiella sp. JEL0407]
MKALIVTHNEKEKHKKNNETEVNEFGESELGDASVQVELNWFYRNRHQITDARLSALVASLTFVMLIFMVIVMFSSKSYGVYPVIAYSPCDPSLSIEWYPIYIFVGVIVFIVYPWVLWKLRVINDTLGLKQELFITLLASFPMFILFFINDNIGFSTYFRKSNVINLMGLLFHTFAVIIPIIRSYDKRKFVVENLTYNMKSFETVLNDPVLLEEFKQYCVRDFSIENALFLEAVNHLSAETTQFFKSLQKSDSPNGASPHGSLRSLSASFTQSSNNIMHTISLKPDYFKQVPPILIPKYLEIFKTFVLPSSPFEINIPAHILFKITTDFKQAGLIKDNSNQTAASSAEPSKTNTGTGKELSFVQKSDFSVAYLPITVFDEAKSHIMNVSFINNFAGFLEEQHAKDAKSNDSNETSGVGTDLRLLSRSALFQWHVDTLKWLVVLDEWDYFLSDLERDTIFKLQTACSELPLPNFDDSNESDETEEISAMTPFDGIPPQLQGSRRSSANFSNVPPSLPPRALETSFMTGETVVDEPIETTQMFFSWFSTVEEEMERGQEDIYRSHLQTVTAYSDACEEIKSKIDQATLILDSLSDNYLFVEEKSMGLQRACEKLLEEQTHLLNVAEQLAANLEYFNALEPITKLLSSSGDNVCLDDRFVPMLVKLDDCLAFVKAHPKYRDSELYLMRFRQCMTRGMTLIKLYFVSQMRAVQNDIKERLQQRPPNELLNVSLYTSLFFVKFRKLAAELQPLIAEIEIRVPGHSEYYALLTDCMQAYFSTRLSLLSPQISLRMANISQNADLLSFARDGCAYMLGLSTDEYILYRQFFRLDEEQLSGYLDQLSTDLYYALRPLILREIKIDTLSQLCQNLDILQSSDIGSTLSLTQSPNADPTIDEYFPDETEFKEELTPVRFVMKRVLEDAQSRLVFRAQSFIRNEIRGFRPREQELLVLARGRGLPQPMPLSSVVGVAPILEPEVTAVVESKDESKLVDGAEEKTDDENSNKQELSEIISGKLVYGGGEWYPTLQRTLYILGKLYKCVPNAVFEDLAQEAVAFCLKSLLFAGNIIASKQSKLDFQFFLIKNLLMLREQIIPFDLSFVRKEEGVDFQEMIDAFSSVLSPSKWGFNTLSNALSVGIKAATDPKITQSFTDSKLEVDVELKRVCERFIMETAKDCVEPVSSFILKVSAFRNSRDLKSQLRKDPLSTQNFGIPDNVIKITEEFKNTTSKTLTHTLQKMTDYLGDKKTEEILIRVIQNNISETYKIFLRLIEDEYDKTLVSRLPTIAEIEKLIKDIGQAILNGQAQKLKVIN